MTARLAAVLAALGASALAAAGVAAAQPPPRPLDPDTAAALVAGSPETSGSSTRAVSSREAFRSASDPGANVWVDPGLSLAQAVGLAPAASVETSAATTAGPDAAIVGLTTVCWANAAWHEWGTWPYQQRITDTTYWCAIYGSRITYRSSSVTGSGTLCGTSWTSSQLVAGGVGYSWFTMRSSAGFSCPTAIPWLVLHPSHYEDIARNDWGSTSTVRSG
jgi:hypothetical protein